MMLCELNNILHLELTALLAAGSVAGLTRWCLVERTICNSLLDKMPWTVKNEIKYRNEKCLKNIF